MSGAPGPEAGAPPAPDKAAVVVISRVSTAALYRQNGKIWNDSQLSAPRMSLKTPFNPNRFKKYHESALKLVRIRGTGITYDTQRTSKSGMAISLDRSDLNPIVRGNGNLTDRRKR